MADPPSPSGISPRNSSIRRRGAPARSTPTLETIPDWPERRNSTLSDTISEARNSIRSSTDDLFLPRVARHNDGRIATEESHWHSAPLALALMPAIAGVMFKEGSSFVTDVTLLVLAAIFLNWSVRLPWYVKSPIICFSRGTSSHALKGLVSVGPGYPAGRNQI